MSRRILSPVGMHVRTQRRPEFLTGTDTRTTMEEFSGIGYDVEAARASSTCLHLFNTLVELLTNSIEQAST